MNHFQQEDANNPNTFYCANCMAYYPLKTKGYYYRIYEVENHNCPITEEQKRKEVKK